MNTDEMRIPRSDHPDRRRFKGFTDEQCFAHTMNSLLTEHDRMAGAFELVFRIKELRSALTDALAIVKRG